MILYQYPSPLGIMLLTMEDNSFTDICLTPSSTHEHWHPYPPLPQPYANDLDQYFKGVPVALDWPITLKGTPFQKRVWQKLRKSHMGTPPPIDRSAKHSTPKDTARWAALLGPIHS